MYKELFQQGGLSFDRLRTFCLVAEAGSLTRAAGDDPIKQSLFSRQIKELEEFFAVELIRRQGRGVAVTPAGGRLCRLIREHFAVLSDFKNDYLNHPVELVIGAGDSVVQWLLLPRLKLIRERLPGVNLRFLNLPTAEITKRLAEGSVDLGLVRKNAIGRSLKSVPLGRFKYSLFLPLELANSKGHNAASMKVLDGLPLATLEGDGNFRRELAAVAEKGRVRLNIQIEC